MLATRPGEEAKDLLQRIELELEFVKAFAEALNRPGWIGAVASANEKLERLSLEPGESLEAVIKAIENDLAEVGAKAKTYTIHCVGHGHIDMNWMWSWPETVSMTHDTFASVLNLMEEFPDLTYSQSQTSVYEAVRLHHPAMFEEIKKRVKEGRWEITAPHWVEGDKNLASGESLCRHLLYSREFFKEHFGLEPEDVPIDWEPDTFGHANTIPMIDSAGGVKYYYACRTGGGQEHTRTGPEKPPLFYWQAPDGSRVLVNRETTWYNSYVYIGDNVALPLVRFLHRTNLHDWLNVYGIGNHGGGPTRKEIEYLKKLDSFPIYPRLVFSTARKYFEAVETEVREKNITLPLIDYELNFEFTGCYTSQSLIKYANRYGENYCVEAEALALVASQDQREALREAWIKVLFNQFHDILPGSGVRETREHAMGLFQEVGASTGAIKREALKQLASSIDTVSLLPNTPEADAEKLLGKAANTGYEAGAGMGAGTNGFSRASGGGRKFKPFVVYNPCAWVRSEPVKVHLYDTDFEPANIVAMDEQGKSHPTMFIEKAHDWGHDRLTVLFHAMDVPALGYRTYVFCEGVADVEVPRVKAVDSQTFASPFLTGRFDSKTGGLENLKMNSTDQEVAAGYVDFGTWFKEVESDHKMSAWVLGERVSTAELKSTSFKVGGPKWDVSDGQAPDEGALAGLVDWTLSVPDSNESTVKLQAVMHPLYARIDFEAKVDWREIGTAKTGIPGLFVEFHTIDWLDGKIICETPFGSVSREKADESPEYPSLRYVNFTAEDGRSCTLVQDCKYGFQAWDCGFQMRVVRSSFNPDHAPEVAQTKLRYALYLHENTPTIAELTRLGMAWNHPFIVAPADLQTGQAPAVKGFVEVENESVVLSSIKKAQHENGIVLRLVEYSGVDTAVKVKLDRSLLEGKRTAVCVDVLERPVDGDVVLGADGIAVTVKANGFVSVLIR
jgi:alpha-mannosidase